MPLYFFDVIDNGALSRDDYGIELASFEEARDQAQVLLPDMARTELPGCDQHTFVCEVREEMRGLVYRGSLTYQGTSLASPLVPLKEGTHDPGRIRDEDSAGNTHDPVRGEESTR